MGRREEKMRFSVKTRYYSEAIFDIAKSCLTRKGLTNKAKQGKF